MDYEEITKKAKYYAIRKGFNEDEAEDFAQECAIKSFEKGVFVKFEYILQNYRQHHRADKRKLSTVDSALSGIGTLSLDAPVDSSNEDSTRFADLIGRDDHDMGFGVIVDEYSGLIEAIIKCSGNEETMTWARRVYFQYIEDNL